MVVQEQAVTAWQSTGGLGDEGMGAVSGRGAICQGVELKVNVVLGATYAGKGHVGPKGRGKCLVDPDKWACGSFIWRLQGSCP